MTTATHRAKRFESTGGDGGKTIKIHSVAMLPELIMYLNKYMTRMVTRWKESMLTVTVMVK